MLLNSIKSNCRTPDSSPKHLFNYLIQKVSPRLLHEQRNCLFVFIKQHFWAVCLLHHLYNLSNCSDSELFQVMVVFKKKNFVWCEKVLFTLIITVWQTGEWENMWKTREVFVQSFLSATLEFSISPLHPAVMKRMKRVPASSLAYMSSWTFLSDGGSRWPHEGPCCLFPQTCWLTLTNTNTTKVTKFKLSA